MCTLLPDWFPPSHPQAHVPNLGPQSFAALVWSLGVQHPAGSAPPSTYLMEKLAQTLKHHLASQPSSSSAMASSATDAQTSAIPAAPEAPLCNRQVVALVTTLTRLGLPDHSEGLPRLICASLQVRLLYTQQ